jgi:hypothetical protein
MVRRIGQGFDSPRLHQNKTHLNDGFFIKQQKVRRPFAEIEIPPFRYYIIVHGDQTTNSNINMFII